MHYLFILFFSLHLFAYGFSEEILREKLTGNPPQWMLDEIHRDFAPFMEKGITKEMVKESFAQINSSPIAYNRAWVHAFEIRNNVVIPLANYGHARSDGLVDVCSLIAKYVELPDTDFLVSFWDRFDNPSFLHKCTVPVFVICKEKHNKVAARIPWYTHLPGRESSARDTLKAAENFPWEKKQEVAYWRGSTTDIPYTDLEWDYRPRARAMLFSREHPDLVDASFSHPAWLGNEMFNHFTEKKFFEKWHHPHQQVIFKYLLAIDGVSFPSSLYWSMHANSVIIKAESDQEEWFYGALKPYVHYVPYQPDCSDLEEVINWLKTHDEEAQQIAKNAREFAVRNLTNEDLYLYIYLLIKEYAKLMRD